MTEHKGRERVNKTQKDEREAKLTTTRREKERAG